MAQNAAIQSGPMIGHTGIREATIWVQTTEAAAVLLRYWDINNPEMVFETEAIETSAEHGFTAHLSAKNLEPNQSYGYSIEVDGVENKFELPFKTQALWKNKEDVEEWSFALGSCTYINEETYDRNGEPYGGDYQIFEEIASDTPNMMLWLGDNIYLRAGEWQSHSGVYGRYTHTRSTPEMQGLLSMCPNYAIWDDHDFGPNDANGSFPFKELTRQAFTDFWANPSYGFDDEDPIFTSFSFNNVDFFLLDNRWNRTANERETGDRIILGEYQMQWFINALSSSKAKYKFVAIGGQVLNTAQVFENYSTFPDERERLLDEIFDNGISGVVFLTGDRHHTELSKKTIEELTVYDLTVSPLTSGAATENENEGNELRVDGTYCNERNYGQVTVKPNGELVIKVKDAKGELVWKKSISIND